MKLPILLTLCLSTPAFANGLDDLKNAITPLQGQGVLHGVYEAKQHKTDLDTKAAKPQESATAFGHGRRGCDRPADPLGRALLKRAAEEAAAPKGKKTEALYR